MEPLPGISHTDLLQLVLSVALLLGTARLLGELCLRIGMPTVVGEILAGVVLGPSLLSGLFPSFGALVVPDTAVQSQLLDLVGLIGVMLLLVVIGMETDLGLIRARLRISVGVALGGLLLPFASGLVAGALFPDDLLADPGQRGVFALFLAVALALSAIPVLAKILSDLGLMRLEFGQTALAAGMIDDILGWTLLGVVTSLADAGRIDPAALALTLGAVVLFLAATVIVARPLSRWGLHLVQDRARSKDAVLTLVVGLAFAWGAFSHALHLEPILGAFAIGVLFGQTRRLPLEVSRQLESVTFGVFAPVFLATAGLRLDLARLLEPRLLTITVILLVVAAAGKIVGAYAGARWLAKTDRRHALAYGFALNARGVLGIIVAAIGLSIGVFNVQVYSMMVLVSVVTSLIAPIGVRLALGGQLLERSDEEWGTGFASVRRVLMPVRARAKGGGEVQSLEAAALARLAGDGVALTLFTVVDRGQRRVAAGYLDQLAELFPAGTEVTKRVVVGRDPAAAVVAEAEKGYDLVVMGASEAAVGDDHLFSSVIDEVVRLVPCPSLVFRARRGAWPPRRIMVPTGGSPAARKAAELAFSLAGKETEVLVFHVVDSSSTTAMAMGRPSAPAVRMDIGQDIVRDLRVLGERSGVSVVTEVEMGEETLAGILGRAEQGIDLLVVGTAARAGSTRLYLGPKVERLLAQSPCSVIVLNI